VPWNLTLRRYDEKGVMFRIARIPEPDDQQRRLPRSERDLVAYSQFGTALRIVGGSAGVPSGVRA